MLGSSECVSDGSSSDNLPSRASSRTAAAVNCFDRSSSTTCRAAARCRLGHPVAALEDAFPVPRRRRCSHAPSAVEAQKIVSTCCAFVAGAFVAGWAATRLDATLAAAALPL
jgi:hypothetical protein